MPRPPRITEPGLAYHLLNRRVMRLALSEKEGDYEAFERVLAASLARPDAPQLLAYCLMPNHWARKGVRMIFRIASAGENRRKNHPDTFSLPYAGSKATLAASLDRIQHAATAIISAILDDKAATRAAAA